MNRPADQGTSSGPAMWRHPSCPPAGGSHENVDSVGPGEDRQIYTTVITLPLVRWASVTHLPQTSAIAPSLQYLPSPDDYTTAPFFYPPSGQGLEDYQEARARESGTAVWGNITDLHSASSSYVRPCLHLPHGLTDTLIVTESLPRRLRVGHKY